MFKRCLVVGLLFIVPCASRASDTLALTARQREAFEYLRGADLLESPAIGIAGSFSRGYLAMRIVSRSPSADKVFKELIRSGTLVGQLYGLCGVRRTDPAYFAKVLPRYQAMREEVNVINGCVMGAEPVSHIVKAERGIQLRDDETLAEWATAHPQERGRTFDIAGGGYTQLYLQPAWSEAEVLAAEAKIEFR